MPRFATIADIAAAGLELRIWCLRCARGRQLVASQVPPAFAQLPILVAISKMRCSGCRRTDAVILVPASPPRTPEDDIVFDPNYDGARVVAEMFHLMRSMAKARRSPPPPPLPKDRVKIAGQIIAATRIALDEGPGSDARARMLPSAAQTRPPPSRN